MPLDATKLVGVQRYHGKITAQCPVCQENSRSHLVIFPDGKFGCVVNSDPSHRKEIWRLIGTDAPGTTSDEERMPEVEPPPTTWPLSILDRLVKDHSYWNRRGISDETLAPFRGGVATIGQLADRYVFPILNEGGEIIGFDGRCVKDMTPQDRKQFRRVKWKRLGPNSSFIWGGLDEIVDRVILVESIGDSLKLREHGVSETLCMFGTTVSEKLAGWLIAHNPRQIIISTNLDEEKQMGNRRGRPGQEAAVRAQKMLATFFDEGVVSVVHPVANDWGDSTPEQIQAAFGEPPATREPEICSEISLDTDPKSETLSP